MLTMSGAIVILTGAVYMLGNMDSGVLAKGITAIAGIGLIFAGLIAVTKFAGSAAKTIAFIAGSIAALAVVTGLMSMIDPSRLANATAAISSIMGMMALVIASTKLAKSAEKAIITIGIVVAGLGGIIYALASLPAQSVLASAGALSMLMLSLSASMLIISKSGNVSMQAIGALAVLELAVAGIAVILGVMGTLDVNPSIETAASLSLMLLSLAGVTAIPSPKLMIFWMRPRRTRPRSFSPLPQAISPLPKTSKGRTPSTFLREWTIPSPSAFGYGTWAAWLIPRMEAKPLRSL